MTYRAIIFDLDGTLLDTLQDLADSVNDALRQMGFPEHPVNAFRFFVGEGREVMARRSLPETNRDTKTVEKLSALTTANYERWWARNTKPYPGIPELLDGLTQRGLKMAVLSNKPHDFTQKMVSAYFAKWRFDFIAGAQPSIPPKPDPAGVLMIARTLGVNTAECLYLGDSNIDMKTAVGAGMYPVGAGWGFRSEAELVAAGAKVILHHPVELLGII